MASAYLVRDIESKAIVGIYFARSIEELADLVDESTSPGLTEYSALPSGGIEWDGGDDAQKIPMPMLDDTASPEAWDTLWQSFWKGAATNLAWRAIWKEVKWKRFLHPAYPTKEELEKAGPMSHLLEVDRLGKWLLDQEREQS